MTFSNKELSLIFLKSRCLLMTFRSSPQPKIDRPANGRGERKHYFFSFACGSVCGIYNLEHCTAIFAGYQWLFILLYTFNKMFQFMWIALVKNFFKYGKAPADRCVSFFHRITVAGFAIRY